MRPRRPSSPRSERRSARIDTSESGFGSTGTWTRRPSVVITTATIRRSCRSNWPKLGLQHAASARSGPCGPRSLAGFVRASTPTRWSCPYRQTVDSARHGRDAGRPTFPPGRPARPPGAPHAAPVDGRAGDRRGARRLCGHRVARRQLRRLGGDAARPRPPRGAPPDGLPAVRAAGQGLQPDPHRVGGVPGDPAVRGRGGRGDRDARPDRRPARRSARHRPGRRDRARRDGDPLGRGDVLGDEHPSPVPVRDPDPPGAGVARRAARPATCGSGRSSPVSRCRTTSSR